MQPAPSIHPSIHPHTSSRGLPAHADTHLWACQTLPQCGAPWPPIFHGPTRTFQRQTGRGGDGTQSAPNKNKIMNATNTLHASAMPLLCPCHALRSILSQAITCLLEKRLRQKPRVLDSLHKRDGILGAFTLRKQDHTKQTRTHSRTHARDVTGPAATRRRACATQSPGRGVSTSMQTGVRGGGGGSPPAAGACCPFENRTQKTLQLCPGPTHGDGQGPLQVTKS
jgi:hypothetical protein